MPRQSKTFSLGNVVGKYLNEHPEQKFTAREIADWVCEEYPEDAKRKLENATKIENEKALVTQFVAEIGERRVFLQKEYGIKTIEDRPRKFYFTNKPDDVDDSNNKSIILDQTGRKKSIKEYDLYPMLSQFLFLEQKVYTKRIDEKRGRKKKGPSGNKWLYPDLVGMEDLSSEWNEETKAIFKVEKWERVKLWSFEVKTEINRSNIRQAFFQCVSNSSWANFGYLVAGNIQGSDTLKEVRMLSSLHGIGLIRLNIENSSESEIIIPAKERPKVDWNIADRLVEENKDFLGYIKLVRHFFLLGEIKFSDWDAIAELDLD